jgi:Ca-activated chloride channel family protein
MEDDTIIQSIELLWRTACSALALWACFLLSSSSFLGQTLSAGNQVHILPTAQDRSEAPAPSIRVNSDLVLIPVSVVDHHDQLITGLKKDHFQLFDDKVEQVITHFTSENAPTSIGFVFDASGSMADKLSTAREAVSRFLETANRDDEFFLVQFNDRVELLQGLTHETAQLQNRLLWIRPNGQTALLDAIYISIQEMKQAHNTRKVLILISDGGDNRSLHSMGEVKNAVREADVQIYAIGIFDPPAVRSRTHEELVGPALLDAVARQTGGRSFEIGDVRELPEVGAKVGLVLCNQYVLGYAPANPKRDGKYHQVKVVLNLPKDFPKARTSWRRGYYAPVD